MSTTNGSDEPRRAAAHFGDVVNWLNRPFPKAEAPPPIAVPTSNGVAMISRGKTGTTSERVVKIAGTAILVMFAALVCVFLAWVMATMIRDIVGM